MLECQNPRSLPAGARAPDKQQEVTADQGRVLPAEVHAGWGNEPLRDQVVWRLGWSRRRRTRWQRAQEQTGRVGSEMQAHRATLLALALAVTVVIIGRRLDRGRRHPTP